MPATWVCQDHLVTDGGESLTSVADFRADGFEPIASLCGELDLADFWPDQHRRVVPDPRMPEATSPDAIPGAPERLIYLVRSPWQSVSNEEAVGLLQRWLRKASPRVDGELGTERRARLEPVVSKFLSQDESWIRAYREGHSRAMH